MTRTVVAATEPVTGNDFVATLSTHERPQWLRRYMRRSVPIDVVAAALALITAYAIRHLTATTTVDLEHALPIGVFVALPMWIVALAANGVYERRLVGSGTDEYRKVLNAGLVLFAMAASAGYMLQISTGRVMLLWAAPMMTLFTIIARHLHRKRLHRRRGHGLDLQRTLLVGWPGEFGTIANHLQRQPWAGFEIVGACSPEPFDPSLLPGDLPMALTSSCPGEVEAAIASTDADTLIVTNVNVLGPSGLRDLTWDLEGSRVQLIVAPAITDIAGPRITSRPVAGLPLLHVEEPRLSITGRVFKAVFDRTLAIGALVLLSPVLLVIALLVKLTSRGPVLYRQTRVGLNGDHFTLLKFRTMVAGADEMVPGLATLNEASGPLFKVRDDPRCTRVGRFLRRFSLDELPQLVHVLSGKMSVVGPRPPLPSEVESYDSHFHRRFLVRPGITGLWQVNGRSDLPWDEAVRLDLYYVDNWSPTMDLAICMKTISAVLRGLGAY